MAAKNTIEIIITAEDKAGKILGGVGDGLQSLGTVALGAAGVVAGAVAGIGAGLLKLAVDAAPVAGVQAAFEGLAESAGRSSDDLLAALKDSSAGMIAQTDLMTSFNKAAQLVGIDFAQTLPDAMGFLAKTAAATGEDMDFMLNSLVTGIGRLSPMILDNLGIQVSLTEATEVYAESIGKSVDELTKSEQQTALMNQVLEKLAINTAAMPDVAGSAAAGIAGLSARFEDIKDTIGLAVLPVLQRLMDAFSQILDKILPPVIEFIETRLVPIMEDAAFFVQEFVRQVLSGKDPLEALEIVLKKLELPEDLLDGIWNFIGAIQEIIAQVAPYIETAAAWIAQNIELQDVLIALGIAIATVVVPAMLSLLLPVIEIVAILALVTAAVALLREAWENDFLGIRTAFENAWAVLQPALERLWAMFQSEGPSALATLRAFWDNTLEPVFQQLMDWLKIIIPAAIDFYANAWAAQIDMLIGVVGYMTETLFPTLQEIARIIIEVVNIALEELTDIWENVLLPALELVWDFIEGSIIPLFLVLAELAEAVLGLAITVLAGIWDTVLYPALSKVYDFIADFVMPIFNAVVDVTQDELGPILDWLANTVLPALAAAFDLVVKAIEWLIDQAKRAIQLLDDLAKAADKMFDSPQMKLEIGFTGVAEAVRQLSAELPPLTAGMMSLNAASAASGFSGVPAGGAYNYYFNQTINTRAGAAAVRHGYEEMKALVGAR